MPRSGLIIVAAAAAAAGVLLLWPAGQAIEIVDRTGSVVFCTRAGVGQEFVLSFVHSVNRRPVYDTLRVEVDHLVIVRSRFDTFGAGMPEASTPGRHADVAKDGWMEWTVNRPDSRNHDPRGPGG